MKSENLKKITYRKQAEYIIKNLRKRNMDGLYFDEAREAVEAICSMIPPESLVGLGGSVTIMETGLVEALRTMEIRLLDRYKEGVTKEEVNAMRSEGLLSDVFIASTNAITLDGRLINQDGLGNRVA
ncbi:MAG: LUD domain-containing protein, partial [Bacteroidia bacterium]|nr:LUD domain-containing protein [Bacteroidia bacterium]